MSLSRERRRVLRNVPHLSTQLTDHTKSAMSSLAELESELAQREDDLNTCNEMLALDPNSTDALETIPILEADIADLRAKIAAKNAEAPPPPPPDDDAPPPPPKYDMSKHPKFRNASPEAPPPPPEETQAVFNVKDLVMAKWSEDKQWYQATIVSKTGSSTDPVYKVTFKGYGNTETKRKHEIRAIIENNKKRKADGSPAITAPSGSSQAPSSPKPAQAAQASQAKQNGPVISAAPFVDTTLVKKKEPSKVSDGPTRLPPEPKKLKGSKALDKQKSSWQDFQKSGPKKAAFTSGGTKHGKDSQFRTPDLPGAKGEFCPVRGWSVLDAMWLTFSQWGLQVLASRCRRIKRGVRGSTALEGVRIESHLASRGINTL